jgi:hypothetical protein
MAKTYECPFHNQQVTGACPDCMREYDLLPDPETMTSQERGDEMLRWDNVLTVPFDKLHVRIEKLVGRGVFTHEMGLNYAGLVDEAYGREVHPTDEEIIARLQRAGHQVIEINLDAIDDLD